MKKLTALAAILIAGVITLHAQDPVGFTYDAAGNRVQRVILLKDLPVDSSELSKFQDPEKYTENFSNRAVNIYPNPTKGLLTIEVVETGTDTETPFEITVYNLQGKLIFRQTNVTGTTEVDLYEQSSGTYILKLRSGKDQSEWKVIKE